MSYPPPPPPGSFPPYGKDSWAYHHHPHHPPHHPPHHHPHHHPHYPPHHGQPPTYFPLDGGQVTQPGPSPYPYYINGTMMIPVPIAPIPPMPAQPETQPTYITNHYYQGEQSNSSSEPVQIAETSGDFEWVPTTSTTANMLTGRAVLGGHEGWDGSPLWVIRSWHNGDLIPGKLSVRHCAAYVMYDGKEVSVQNIEVLCSKPESLRWVPASNGNVPPAAIPGGNTASGETLYIGRARYQLSLTPGKIQPSHRACYIGFAGREVAHKVYDVLCRIS